MSEASIITLAIVGGIVALFWIVIHYAYKLQANERRQKQTGGDGSLQIQVDGDMAAWPLSDQQAARLRHWSN